MQTTPSMNHEPVEAVARRQHLPAMTALETGHALGGRERFRRLTLRSAPGFSQREDHHHN